jgi:mannitol-1-/sugar-/sorbitol-6-/2-deoxyglucose-6-phosphatase
MLLSQLLIYLFYFHLIVAAIYIICLSNYQPVQFNKNNRTSIPAYPLTFIFAAMKLDTVIFDMDGLLIDSEPLWARAAEELFAAYGIGLTEKQYATTTGMRTKEFLHHWFSYFSINDANLLQAEEKIITRVVELVRQQGRPMPGVDYIFNFFKSQGFKMGLATSSGMALIDVVVDMLNIGQYLSAVSSAEGLAYGKPHPEVYLNCAKKMAAEPRQCICFEDSFNGMIAAKAAGMKCVVIPAANYQLKTIWDVADFKLGSLADFNELFLNGLGPR